MLRILTLKRSLHTLPRLYTLSTPRSHIAFWLGASFTTAYIGWRFTSPENRIFADSLHASTTKHPTSKAPEQAPSGNLEPSSILSSDTAPSPDSPTPLKDDSRPSTGQDVSDAHDNDDESSQAAFNPVTGEINWDCPCLGGMAHGPCGPQFREAFSCFVYSEREPKGIDCVEKFKGMQDCFREHPEVYADEIDGDDDEDLVEGGRDLPDSLDGHNEPLEHKESPIHAKPRVQPGKVIFEAPEAGPPPVKPRIAKQ